MVKTYLKQGVPYFHKGSMEEAQAFVDAHLGKERPSPPHLMPPVLVQSDSRHAIFTQPQVALELTIEGGGGGGGRGEEEVVLSDGLGWMSFHLPRDQGSVAPNAF